MKIFFATRDQARKSSVKGKRVDMGTNARKRWAIELKKECKA